MKIVIAGAGAVGFNLAELLAKENQDITLIDFDDEILHHAANHLDVMTLKGDATSLAILEEAEAKYADLFIAVTTSEANNLLIAILAKQLGAKKTIARVNNPEYFVEKQKENFRELGIDVLISPQLLASLEVERLLQRGSFTDIFEFEEGKISIVGFTLDTTSPLIGRKISDIYKENTDFVFKGIAILRGHKTIIPRGYTTVLKGDHLYIAAKKSYLDKTLAFAGKQLKPIKKVMIIGGSSLALRTALLLEKNYEVTLVASTKEESKQCIENLSRALVIKADCSNMDILKSEGLENMDAFVALTPNSETNIIMSLMAEEAGVYKTIALVDNVNYTHISKNIGVDTIIDKKLIAANNIFRFVRKGKVEAIASLHGVNAEVIEFEIHKDNRLLKHPIKDLHFPEKAIVAGVVRGNETYIPNGDFMFQLNDKVIVFTLPEAIAQIEKLFR